MINTAKLLAESDNSLSVGFAIFLF